MSKFIWTDEKTETVRDLYLDGHNVADIAGAVGATRNSIISSKLQSMGLQSPRTKSAPPPTPMGRKGALASAAARRVDGGEGTVPKLSRIGFETRRLKGEPEGRTW